MRKIRGKVVDLGMNKKLLEEMEALKARAKATGKKGLKFTLTSGNTSSLGQVIKTKEQADTFMKILKAI